MVVQNQEPAEPMNSLFSRVQLLTVINGRGLGLGLTVTRIAPNLAF